MLHGVDIQPQTSPFTRSLGHQYVLEPELRTAEGARNYAHHLLSKAAERLRNREYYRRLLSLHLRWMGDLGSWSSEISFQETCETAFLLGRLEQLWHGVPTYKPLSVGLTLLDLVPAQQHQPDPFGERERSSRLAPLVDGLNRRFGRNTVGFGKVPDCSSKVFGPCCVSTRAGELGILMRRIRVKSKLAARREKARPDWKVHRGLSRFACHYCVLV
jgi:DNA polymerase IV